MKPRVLKFDVDGLIAKFDKAAYVIHGKLYVPPTEWNFFKPWGLSAKDFYNPMGYDFWVNLEPWPDGMQLLTLAESIVGQENIVFLTSPCQTEGCHQGKIDWFKKHLPRYNPYHDVFIGGAKHKLAHDGAVLLDDSDDNIRAYTKAGGRGLLIPRPWNANGHLTDSDGHFHVGNVQQMLQKVLQ